MHPGRSNRSPSSLAASPPAPQGVATTASATTPPRDQGPPPSALTEKRSRSTQPTSNAGPLRLARALDRTSTKTPTNLGRGYVEVRLSWGAGVLCWPCGRGWRRSAWWACPSQIGATSSDNKGTSAFRDKHHLKCLASVTLPSTPATTTPNALSTTPPQRCSQDSFVSDTASSPTSILPPRIPRLTCVDVR